MFADSILEFNMKNIFKRKREMEMHNLHTDIQYPDTVGVLDSQSV